MYAFREDEASAPLGWLGRVCGFDQDWAAGEGNKGCVILYGFLTLHGHVCEPLQLAELRKIIVTGQRLSRQADAQGAV